MKGVEQLEPHALLVGMKNSVAAMKDSINSSKIKNRSSRRGTVETNPTRNHEVAGLIPGLAQWVKDAVSCDVGRRHG